MNDYISKIINHPMRVPVLVGIVSFGTGAATGYFLGRRTKMDIHELPEKRPFDMARVEAFIKEHEEPDEKQQEDEVMEEEDGLIYESLDEINDDVKSFLESKLEESMNSSHAPEPEVDEIPRNVFAAPSDDWDYEKEVRNRSTEAPYVLHRDEFYADEKGYSQITLTYYSGDNIMVDEDDSPIYSHELITGPMLFGHGSEDPNVFHVRNDKRRAEYEILYDPGLYSIEVLGLHIEDNQRAKDLKHSNNQKFRLD